MEIDVRDPDKEAHAVMPSFKSLHQICSSFLVGIRGDMKNKLIAIAMISLWIVPLSSAADTIVLKSGRIIDAAKCWEDGDLVKCKIYGQVIGYHKNDIAEIKTDVAHEIPSKGFRYDIWQSGISVREAIDIAEVHDIPFHRGGIISVNKTFNPKMCRPYAESATEFYYKDQILGRRATLTFNFTPLSKRLYSLTVAFSGPGISKTSDFKDQVESMLRVKYDRPPKNIAHIFFEVLEWKINRNATVTMRAGGNSIHIIYSDLKLFELFEKEKNELVRSGFTKNDKNKF